MVCNNYREHIRVQAFSFIGCFVFFQSGDLISIPVAHSYARALLVASISSPSSVSKYLLLIPRTLLVPLVLSHLHSHYPHTFPYPARLHNLSPLCATSRIIVVLHLFSDARNSHGIEGWEVLWSAVSHCCTSTRQSLLRSLVCRIEDYLVLLQNKQDH